MIELLQLAIAIVSLVVSSVVIPIWLYVRRLRDNHIHSLGKSINDLNAYVQRIDDKLSQHIQWHLGGESRSPSGGSHD